jgi:hypothetical protein
VLRIRYGDRTDVVVYDARTPVKVPVDDADAVFRGAVGVLTLHGGQVEHAYALGAGGWTYRGFSLVTQGAQKRAVRSASENGLIIAGPLAGAPAPGNVVRLLTDDGWVYPFTVTSAEQTGDDVLLKVDEGPGMTYDGRTLRLVAFPQRVHSGTVKVEWLPTKPVDANAPGWKHNGR